MNTIRFRFIVLIMSIAMLGLIGMQVYWLKHDYDLKAQQFDQNIMQALNRMVEQIEESENQKIVVKNFISNGDSTIIRHGLNDSLLQLLFDLAPAAPAPPPPPPIPGELVDIKKEIGRRIESYRKNNEVRIKADESKLVQLDSTIDIRIEKDIQQKEVYALKMNDQQLLPDSLYRQTEKRVQSKLNKLNSMMQKLTFQIIDPNGNIFDRISLRSLDSIIRIEMKNRNISNVYTYGVIGSTGKELLYADSSADSSALINSKFRLNLFPNDVFRKNESLSIAILDKNNFLFQSIFPLFLLSFVFSGLIIWGFSYTLMVILRQKKLAQVKNDFINNMTHEFKTPIATIAIANETLNDPRIYEHPDKLKFYTNIIRDENQRMLRQVETVLQMAQIDKGELVIKMEQVNLAEIIDSAIGSMKLTVEQRGGKIITSWNASNSMINADPNHLVNVIINLLDNANKYSPSAPEIKIEAFNSGNHIEVSISDKGIGIPRDILPRIFDNFFRVSTGNIHDVKGFGLGLSYVKAIMDKLGGQIKVNSEPGKGSTFTLILPTIKT